MMCIQIDDLVGNAFCSYLEETGSRILSLSKIEKFGQKIVEDLKEQGIESRLLLSRNRTEEFFNQYSSFFTSVCTKNEIMVVLNNNITENELIEKFSGYLTLPVLLSFIKKSNTQILLE